MAQRFNSTSVTVTANGTLSPFTAATDTIVSSVALQGASGGTHTIQVQKSGGSPVDVYKPSGSGEVLPAPFALETGDALKIVTTGYSSDSTFLISYAYESESFAGESIGVHNDVNLTGLADGDVLVYNGTSGDFEPGAGGGGGGASSLDDLSDVTVTTPSVGDFLIESGTGFVNRTAYATDLEMSSSDSTAVSTKILTNTSNIATNASGIANAGTLISANSVDISTNTASISNNANDISNLTTQLNTANANIASNDVDIATLQTDISDAGTLINANAVDIATNTANISNNDAEILSLQNSVNTYAGYISDINNGVGNVIAVKVDGQADITGTVTLAEGPNVTLTQSGSTIIIDSTGGGGGGGSDSFNTIAVSGQSDVVAESGNDTLNLAVGTGITITTNASTDTVTFAADTSVLATDAELASLAATVGANTAAISSNDGEIAILQAATHVNSFNGLTGAVTISAGSGINLSPSGNNIEIVGTATSTTINNNAATRIITGSGTANTLNAETGLTWGFDTLTVDGEVNIIGEVIANAVSVKDITYTGGINISTPNNSSFPAQGEISPIGGSGLTEGQLYYLNSSGVWTLADATAEASCKNMLGIAVATNKVMIRGHLCYTAYAGFADGEPLYVKPSSTGDITNVVPFVSGHIVRKIGFCLDGSVRSIYFNPSNDYFEVE